MALPLDGIKVVEYCSVLAGPCAAMLLADLGAEVIKVEPPGTGDSARQLSPAFPDSDGLSLGFLTFNRNKRSILLDVYKPKGLEVAHRLTRWADVMVINMRVGSPDRLGIGYEQLAKINPRLVYASMTSLGEKGPEATLPGFDIVTQARSGVMEVHRPADRPPVNTSLFNFDMANAMLAAYGTAVALLDRVRTGKGQKVEVNLLQSSIMLHAIQMTRAIPVDQEPVPPALAPAYPSKGGGLPNRLPTIYPCSDGRYILFMMPAGRWPVFCRALGLNDLGKDPTLQDGNARNARAQEIYDVLSRRFATKPAAEWEAILKAADQVASVVKHLEEVYDDPQVVANEMITTFDQPGFQHVTAINTPVRLSASAGEARIRRPAPTLGQHTQEILQELGYTDEQIVELAAEEILG